MNKLLINLIGQSVCLDDGTTLDGEELIKLVVNECTLVCERVASMATLTNTGEKALIAANTAKSCAKIIKLTFGVTE